jgi:hypothetical protein
MTLCPQLFVAVVPHLPPHAMALSGAQHVPSAMQISLLDAQAAEPVGPQATSWPQLFIIEPQFRPAHVVACGSGLHPHAPAMHIAPPSQPPQSTGRLQLSNCLPHRFVQ